MSIDFGKVADDAIKDKPYPDSATGPTWSPGVEPGYEHQEPVTAEVVTDDPLDLVAAENHFLVFTSKLPGMAKAAAEIQIADSASYETASQMVIQLKQILKLAEKAKDGHHGYQRANEFLRHVQKVLREKVVKPVNAILTQTLSPKFSAYQREQAELQRRIQAKQMAEEAKKRQAAMEEERCERLAQGWADLFMSLERQIFMNRQAKEAGLDKEQFVKVEMPEAPAPAPVMAQTTKVQVDGGTVDMKPDWKIVVRAFADVPDRYKVFDEKAVRRDLDNGVDPKGIPGLEITEDFKMSTRVKSK